jgi:hypothetical protein
MASFSLYNICAIFCDGTTAVDALFMMQAVGLLLVGYWLRKLHPVTELFFGVAIYNLIDELKGTGGQIDWLEYFATLVLILFLFLKYKKKDA